MKPGRTHLKAPLAVPLLLAALALAAPAWPARAQEQEVPRRPRGPAAGPIIKLPRGEGAPADEQRQPAETQKAQPAAALKWEYCTLTGYGFRSREVGLSLRSIPTAVIHCQPSAPQEVEGATHEHAIANALERLGEDGWELVAVRETFKLSEGTGESQPVFYLKRPKRQE